MRVGNKFLRFELVAILLAATVGCKKDSNPTEYDRILGKWKQVQFATDDNGNGLLDPQELHSVAKTYSDILAFNNDSEGLETVFTDNVTTNYAFSWYLTAADTLQRNGIGHDTILYQIQDITSLHLTLMTTSKVSLVWYIYAKQ